MTSNIPHWNQFYTYNCVCVCVCVFALTFNCPCRIHCKSSSPLSYRLWLHICSDLWHNIKLKMSDHLITICCPSGKLKCSTVFLSFFYFGGCIQFTWYRTYRMNMSHHLFHQTMPLPHWWIGPIGVSIFVQSPFWIGIGRRWSSVKLAPNG